MIYTAHGFNFYQGEMPLKNAIFLTLEKLAGTWTDHLIVMNREDEIAAKRYSILPAQRVNYMPGIGVDQEHYNPATVSVAEVMRFRQELKIQPETPLFLAIAEFIPRKRHRDMLNAFAKIDRPNAHFAFAGEGVLLPQMQQLACQLGVQNRVHFLGFRQDIPVLIRAAIATVMASEQEGLPRSVMESLCLEIPAIGTKIRGIQELLENGCGLMVPVGEVEGLAQAMVWSLDHPQEMQEMGKRGRELMVDCDLQQILKRHHKLYTQAIDRRSAS
jgi:glycosyltransferase involved in cell wall biosynthesis